MLRHLTVTFLACVLFGSSMASDHPVSVPSRQEVWLSTPEARGLLFDDVADRLQRHHVNRSTLNWQAWRQAYRPGLMAADGQAAIDRAFRRAFRGLNDDHSRWLGRRSQEPVISSAQVGVNPQAVRTHLGANTSVLPGLGLLIERPHAGGLATRAGLHRGDVLTRIGGQALGELPAQELFGVVAQQLEKPAVLAVVLRRGVAKPVVLHPSPQRTDGVRPKPHAQAIPGRPAARLWIPNFEPGTANAVAQALSMVLSDTSTVLLIDVRGNPGGSVSEMLQTLALFAPDVRLTAVTEGSIRWRSALEQQGGTTRVVLMPEDPLEPLGVLAEGTIPAEGSWPGPLAVLVDGRTNSAAEALAGALVHGLGVPAFGTATPGNVETVRRMAFPAGHEAWVAFAELRDAEGERLAPVVPETQKSYRPHDLATGLDAAEAAALAALTGIDTQHPPFFVPPPLSYAAR